ncbi:MAG TPA: hypothetical protein VKJ07_24015, partial [Mycobacteriales bacterium]|nr:hypothetical protein [Mycobacteriales bacterium]
MVTRMSQLFLRTLREDPADAEVPSHRLLVRAGYVRRTAPGIYTWLPLGKRMLEGVAQVVREEMDRIGAQEVLFPALLPKELYETSGRWTEYGEDTFVQCTSCDYTANTEAVEIAVPPKQDPSAHPAQQVLDTPGTPTIETLVNRLNDMDLGKTFTGADTLKNVVLKTRSPGQKEWQLLVVGVPGDREVDLKRIAGQLE